MRYRLRKQWVETTVSCTMILQVCFWRHFRLCLSFWRKSRGQGCSKHTNSQNNTGNKTKQKFDDCTSYTQLLYAVLLSHFEKGWRKPPARRPVLALLPRTPTLIPTLSASIILEYHAHTHRHRQHVLQQDQNLFREYCQRLKLPQVNRTLKYIIRLACFNPPTPRPPPSLPCVFSPRLRCRQVS